MCKDTSNPNMSNIKIGKFKVCMLVYSFYDMDNRVRRYAEELVRQGHLVDVISLFGKGENKSDEKLNGVRIYKIQKRILDEKSKFAYFYRLISFLIRSLFIISRLQLRNRYDLIHVHNVPDFLVFAAILPKIQGSKIILDIHDIVPEFYASKFNKSNASLVFRMLVAIEKLSIKFSDHVIISNHIWFERLAERSISKEKMTVIMNYPDQNIFSPKEKSQRIKGIVLIYPGTLNFHQGLDIAIRAFYMAKNDLSNAQFNIYGDGPERSLLEKMVSDLGLEKQVIFRGRVSIEKLVPEIANADIGIVPKRDGSFGGDAFSTKILEFMRMRIPAIVSETRIDRFYFNEDIVRFFPPEDVEGLSNAIIDLGKRPEERERLVNNAAEFVKNMTWDVKKQDYLDLLDRLVAS